MTLAFFFASNPGILRRPKRGGGMRGGKKNDEIAAPGSQLHGFRDTLTTVPQCVPHTDG